MSSKSSTHQTEHTEDPMHYNLRHMEDGENQHMKERAKYGKPQQSSKGKK